MPAFSQGASPQQPTTAPERSRPDAAPLQPPNLRRAEASVYLRCHHGINCAPATLAKMASQGGGPAFHKAGVTPLYPRAELDRWATARLGPLHSSAPAARHSPHVRQLR